MQSEKRKQKVIGVKMDTQEIPALSEVEVTCGNPIQVKQEELLGKVPPMKLPTEKIGTPVRNPRPFRKGDTVYALGFVKAHKGKHFVCKGQVVQTPEKGKRPVYKIKVVAVADSPVGGKFVVEQAVLLNKVITKHIDELHRDLNTFMAPPNWITILPNS